MCSIRFVFLLLLTLCGIRFEICCPRHFRQSGRTLVADAIAVGGWVAIGAMPPRSSRQLGRTLVADATEVGGWVTTWSDAAT